MQSEITTLLTQQAVLLTKMEHVRELIEKQNGRVKTLETRVDEVEDRVTEGEKSDIKTKAWLSGLAAGIGAFAAIGVEKLYKLYEKAQI